MAPDCLPTVDSLDMSYCLMFLSVWTHHLESSAPGSVLRAWMEFFDRDMARGGRVFVGGITFEYFQVVFSESVTASDLGASNRDQQKPRHGGLLLETARSLARWMMRFARITESHGLSLAKAAERTLKGGFGVHLGSKFFDEMTRQKSYPMWALHWLILKFFAGVILISEVACHINILFETHSLLFWMASLFVATNPCPDISTAGLHWSGRSSRVRV